MFFCHAYIFSPSYLQAAPNHQHTQVLSHYLLLWSLLCNIISHHCKSMRTKRILMELLFLFQILGIIYHQLLQMFQYFCIYVSIIAKPSPSITSFLLKANKITFCICDQMLFPNQQIPCKIFFSLFHTFPTSASI